jgi:hypothetical protein
MAKLFGFSIDDKQKTPPSVVSPVPQNNEDGVDHYLTSGFFGSYVDIEGVYRTEYDLIKRYREMALHPECDSAIEDIVNEAIVSDTNDSPVQIELSNLNASDGIKKKIREEFKRILELLDFDKKCHEIYRNWYIDGRLYYHKVIDLKKPQEGIQELRYIDALKMRYVRQSVNKGTKNNNQKSLNGISENPMDYEFPEIEEYFIYNPSSQSPIGTVNSRVSTQTSGGIKISRDAVSYCTSGLVDRNKGTTLSYLHKAIKSLNQLRMIEDSIVIYRLSRSSEKRIFYIDIGNLPKIKAEQYMRDVMNRYRNKLVYDSNSGEIRDDRKYMAMLEDYWLPRKDGNRGTEVTTLPAGQNLGELADIEYFQKKLYKSLGVPSTRLDAGGGFNLGRSSEILRDELKFTRFVGRLRKRFSQIFIDLLKTQLILKNIVSPEDWDTLSDHIQFDFLYDNHFADLKKNEIMNDKLGVVSAMEPYVGIYFSRQLIRKEILGQSDSEIIEIDKQIKKEIEAGLIPDPATTMMAQQGGEMPPNQQANPGQTLGSTVKEPAVSTAQIEPGQI